jgi:hypothetical protein
MSLRGLTYQKTQKIKISFSLARHTSERLALYHVPQRPQGMKRLFQAPLSKGDGHA